MYIIRSKYIQVLVMTVHYDTAKLFTLTLKYCTQSCEFVFGFQQK